MIGMIQTKSGEIPVKCYLAIVPGFEKYQFIIHHTRYDFTEFDRERFPEPFFGEDWSVSEASTGYNIMPGSWDGGMSNKTRAGAIAIVTKYLTRNKERFVDAMTRCNKEMQNE